MVYIKRRSLGTKLGEKRKRKTSFYDQNNNPLTQRFSCDHLHRSSPSQGTVCLLECQESVLVMSNTPVRRVSPKDIQVQNLIERCLQLYMNRTEVVETLLAQAKIEPGFTELVWQKLEEENREFFKAYYLRLMVKSQINEFNKLLEQQVRLTRQINQTGVNNMATSNGSHLPPLHHNLACYAPEHAGSTIKPESMHHSLGSNLPNAFTNGGSSLHPTLHSAVEISAHVNNRIDPSPNMLSSSTQNTNMGMMQGINGGIIKSETGYSGASPYVFADGSILEARASLPDGSVASFSSVESSAQTLTEPLLEPEPSFGFLNQIPRNFSLSDLTADFSQSTEILENYSKSSYLVTDNENFLEREREHQDNKRLDTISEGMSYDEFGSE